MKTYVCSFLLGIAALGGLWRAGAQTNAGLNGAVTDASGAVIQGARVSVINRETGMRRATVTNESGLYEFPLLQPGSLQPDRAEGRLQADHRRTEYGWK